MFTASLSDESKFGKEIVELFCDLILSSSDDLFFAFLLHFS